MNQVLKVNRHGKLIFYFNLSFYHRRHDDPYKLIENMFSHPVDENYELKNTKLHTERYIILFSSASSLTIQLILDILNNISKEEQTDLIYRNRIEINEKISEIILFILGCRNRYVRTDIYE